ncbi:o-succinylbenzoate--CoA ligase [Erwiniaceae bacterium CAU 1747]
MAAINDWPWLHWLQRYPQATAIDSGDETLSWQQLAERIAGQANGFRRQGVKPDGVVALRSRNSLEAVLAWLSLLACGAKVLMLNPQLPDAQLDRLLPGLGLSFALSIDAPPIPQTAQLTLAAAPGRVNHPWLRSAPATLTLTSGTTGRAKAAVHTFDAHLLSAAAVIERLDFTPRDRWLLSLPLYHVSGMGIIWRWLSAGATLVIERSQDLSAALARSSFASLVPTQLWRLLNQPTPPSGLRAVLLGGAAIPAELTRQAEAAGIRCWCGYGLTESASTVCVGRADGTGSVGRPLSGQALRLVNGEVWLRSATLAKGYWLDGQLQPLTDEDGWLHTGDLAHAHQGELWIDGRRDNLFFCGGEAVQPEAIERVLLAHPAVTQAVVVPQADSEYGQRPVALVAAEIALDKLADWAAPQLAGYQRPVDWYSLPQLAGEQIKPSRHRLQAWLEHRK